MDLFFKQITSATYPKVMAIGGNYLKHVKEMGKDNVPKEPFFFQKPWTSLLYCPKEMHLNPFGHSVHHQVELGVLIGETARNVSRAQAMSKVAGYFLLIDVTDRTLQGKFKKESLPWFLAKGQDGFLPVSGLIPADRIKDPYRLELQLKIDGVVKQKDITGSMHFKIDEMVEYLSRHVTLNKGDLLCTGTPDGVSEMRAGNRLSATLSEEGSCLAELDFFIK